MQRAITRVNKNKHTFYLQDKLSEQGYYLSKRLAKIFMDYLEQGIFVDFTITGNTKVIAKKECFEVNAFTKIENRRLNKVYFDIDQLRDKMYLALASHEYFLFLDLEMSMPEKNQRNFMPEIIQGGFYLTNSQGDIIKEYNRYVFSRKHQLSNWTINFLQLDINKYRREAISFKKFFYDLVKIIKQYDPQFIIWGDSDWRVLNNNIMINHIPLTLKRERFSNLLALVKSYFQVKTDLGLFTTYKELLKRNDIDKQVHNAFEDAYMTKEIFFYFLTLLKKHYTKDKE